jgi:PAS domain-containing protein
MEETSLIALALFIIGSLIFQSYLSVTHTHRVLLLEKKLPIREVAEETLKNSIAELQESFAALHSVFSIAPVGLAIAEVQQESISFINYNSTTEGLLRRGSKSKAGLPLWSTINECAFWLEKYKSSLESKMPVAFEYVHQGRILSVHLMAAPKTNMLRKDVFSFAIQDVTDQKELKSKYADMETSLKELKGGFLDWDLVTGDIVVSPVEGKQVLGLQASTKYTLASWLERIHREERNSFIQVLDGLMQGKQSYEVTHRFLNCFGEWEWVYNKASVVKSAQNGKPTRASGFVMETGKVGELLEERNFLQAEMHVLSTIANVGVMKTDKSGHCVSANDAWLEMHSQHKRKKKLVDVSLTEKVAEEDKDAVERTWSSYLKNPSHFDIMYRTKDKDKGTEAMRRSIAIGHKASDGALKQVTVFTLPLFSPTASCPRCVSDKSTKVDSALQCMLEQTRTLLPDLDTRRKVTLLESRSRNSSGSLSSSTKKAQRTSLGRGPLSLDVRGVNSMSPGKWPLSNRNFPKPSASQISVPKRSSTIPSLTNSSLGEYSPGYFDIAIPEASH